MEEPAASSFEASRLAEAFRASVASRAAATAAAAEDSTSASRILHEQAPADRIVAEGRTHRETSLDTSTRCCCERTNNCFQTCNDQLKTIND